jgi:hypothetical protein
MLLGSLACYWGFMKRFFHPGRFCGTKTKLTMNRNHHGVMHGSRQLHGGIAVPLKLNQSRELVKAKAVTRFFA